MRLLGLVSVRVVYDNANRSLLYAGAKVRIRRLQTFPPRWLKQASAGFGDCQATCAFRFQEYRLLRQDLNWRRDELFTPEQPADLRARQLHFVLTQARRDEILGYTDIVQGASTAGGQ